MKKHRERKPFKREYIPVIIAVIVLIGLITGLVFVILDKKESRHEKIVVSAMQNCRVIRLKMRGKKGC